MSNTRSMIISFYLLVHISGTLGRRIKVNKIFQPSSLQAAVQLQISLLWDHFCNPPTTIKQEEKVSFLEIKKVLEVFLTTCLFKNSPLQNPAEPTAEVLGYNCSFAHLTQIIQTFSLQNQLGTLTCQHGWQQQHQDNHQNLVFFHLRFLKKTQKDIKI